MAVLDVALLLVGIVNIIAGIKLGTPENTIMGVIITPLALYALVTL